jgi:intracellular sulfur oxidation DsrE/DsrF family protein
MMSALCMPAQAQQSPRYLADIELHTEAELLEALQRSEHLMDEGVLGRNTSSPVRFVLHGPEARILLLQNYSQHKSTVDLAARLSAFGAVDIKVCETWMGGNRVNPSELPPFVGTVPYGPSEESRLRNEEGYIYF